MPAIKYEKSPRKLPPEGRHVMRCFWVVDIGTQKFATTEGRKIWFSFELPEALHQFTKDGPEEPFAVSTSFFWGFGPKSGLRKFAESWRGKTYTDEEAKGSGFDPRKMLGVGAEGVIVHNGEYANIQTIMPLRKKEDCPPAVNKQVYVSLEPEEFDMRSYDRLPNFLREMIQKSPEWKVLEGLGCTDGSFDAEEYLARKNKGQEAYESNRKEWQAAEDREKAERAANSQHRTTQSAPSMEAGDDDIPF